ncbi:MAG: hypothetical protein KDD67_01305 [Ignavibacteriae bacterium]|nr:hypothetical protein [Ignavibacteriota bacterium]MCB9216544.1 hypothetical protein [Ignavibacteria bacterium]
MFDRSWDVLAIAGPSGVGKSRLSYSLARHYDLPIVEVDDLFHAVEALTTPDQQPLIHFWRTHPESADFPATKVLELFLEVSRAISPAVRSVIDNHIETQMPVVLDGDYILPELIAEYSDRVKSIFLYEENHHQIVDNYLQREPMAGDQHKRAEVSLLFGDWLRDECKRLGFLAMPARPWETVVERAVAAVAK